MGGGDVEPLVASTKHPSSSAKWLLESHRLVWNKPIMHHQVTFSCCTRDNLVLSIQEEVRKGYTEDVPVKRLNCFAAEVLNTITDVAVGEICVLFQPQTDRNSVTVSAPPPPASPPAEAPVLASVLEGEILKDEPNREPNSASTPPPPVTPPAEAASVLKGKTIKETSTTENQTLLRFLLHNFLLPLLMNLLPPLPSRSFSPSARMKSQTLLLPHLNHLLSSHLMSIPSFLQSIMGGSSAMSIWLVSMLYSP